MIDVRKIAHLTGHNGAIYCLAHYQNKRFFSAGFDNVIVEWDINNINEAKAVAKLNSKAISLLFIKEKNWLIAGQSTGGVHIIDLSVKKEIHLLQAHQDMVFALCYDENNNNLYIGAADGKISIWNLESMEMLSLKFFDSGKVRDIKINKELVYIGCGDGSVIIATLELKELLKVNEHMSNFSVNTLLLDNQLIYSGSRDGHLNIVKLEELEYSVVDKIPAHNYAIYRIIKSPNGKFLATASRDKSIKIWNSQFKKVIQKINFKLNKGHIASVNDIIWFDNYLVSTGDDRSVIVWEVI